MARKKDEAKPLFGLKQDFYESLDNAAQQGIMLLQAVDMALKHGAVADNVKDILEQRAAAFRASLMSDE